MSQKPKTIEKELKVAQKKINELNMQDLQKRGRELGLFAERKIQNIDAKQKIVDQWVLDELCQQDKTLANRIAEAVSYKEKAGYNPDLPDDDDENAEILARYNKMVSNALQEYDQRLPQKRQKINPVILSTIKDKHTK